MILDQAGNELRVFASILARGGSKGVKKKNIRNLAGKPLVAYSIDIALENSYIDSVFVSTDSHEIAEISAQYGADIPFIRPKNISGDDASVWSAWNHAMKYFSSSEQLPDILIDLPPTSPLRNIEDVNNCIEELVKHDCDVVISVTDSKKNPMFNMIEANSNGDAKLLIETEVPIVRRQDTSKIFDITTVAYAIKKDFLLDPENSSIWDGRVKYIVIPEDRALDIDTEFDFYLASLIVQNLES